MDTTNEFTAIISDKRRLRAALSDFSTSQIEKIQLKLAQIVEKRKIEEEEAQKFQREARETALKNIKDIQEKYGLNQEDAIELILEAGGKKPTARKEAGPKQKLPPKYRMQLENGEFVEWTGRGRTPVAFKEAIQSGKSLTEFLIEPKNS